MGFCGVVIAASLLTASLCAGSDKALAWSLLDHDTPHLSGVRTPLKVRLRIRNEGSETWRPELFDNVAYHWRSLSGEMVQRDGHRTRIPRTVPPGGELELVATVDPVPEAGARILEWEMVRENVAWFGPPLRGNARVAVVFFRPIAVGVLALTLAIALAAAGLRLFRRRGSLWWWSLATVLPPLFAAAAVWIVTTGFAELAGLSLWTSEWALHLSGVALLALPAALAPGRARSWVAGATMLLLAVVGTADLIYMRWFGSLVPLDAFAAVRQVGRVEESIRALFGPGFLWMILLAVPAGLMVAIWPRWKPDEAPSRGRRALVWAVLVAICGLALGPLIRAVSWSLQDPATSRLMFSQQHRVRQWGLINLHVLDACLEASGLFSHRELSTSDRQRVAKLFEKTASGAPPAGPMFGLERRRNLLLIQVESLQEWVVAARVGGEEVMPTLQALRRDGRVLYFSNVFDQAAQGRSSDGEFATLNSMLPRRTGAVAFLNADDHFLALPEILRERGYTTFSAHPFERGFWNRAVLHPRYGFEKSMFQRDLGPGEQIGWGLADGVFFARALEHIVTLPRPFFSFLITLGLHHPFDLFPDSHKVLDVGELADTPLGNYLHAMHYFDASLAGLLRGLEKAGLAESTVVALYGDHSSGLAVDAGLLQVTGIPSWDPSLPARLKKVPFAVLLPHADLAAELDVVGGHIDIAPTLLYLLGVERPRSFLGNALMPGRETVTAQANGSSISDDRIFVSVGALIPDGGACFSFPAGAQLPQSACDRQRTLAKEQLDVADLVIRHDLFREIGEAKER